MSLTTLPSLHRLRAQWTVQEFRGATQTMQVMCTGRRCRLPLAQGAPPRSNLVLARQLHCTRNGKNFFTSGFDRESSSSSGQWQAFDQVAPRREVFTDRGFGFLGQAPRTNAKLDLGIGGQSLNFYCVHAWKEQIQVNYQLPIVYESQRMQKHYRDVLRQGAAPYAMGLERSEKELRR